MTVPFLLNVCVARVERTKTFPIVDMICGHQHAFNNVSFLMFGEVLFLLLIHKVQIYQGCAFIGYVGGIT